MDDYVDVKLPCGKVYVLQLECNKYYIGYTERQRDERFLEHFQNNGSKWTKKYKPLDVLKIISGTLQDEDEITLQYMKKYGWWNVRGGK
jgi:predicted GIY-YIG superfamily endonuclease